MKSVLDGMRRMNKPGCLLQNLSSLGAKISGGDVMKDMMSYKGYYGSVHYGDEDRIFHGG